MTAWNHIGTLSPPCATTSAAVAGSLNSTLTLALLSDARGFFGLADATLTAQTVAVTGAAYDLATPTFASTLAFGNVRRGATSTLAVANTVGVNGNADYQDKLVVAATAGAVLGVTSPAAVRWRLIEATDTVRWW